MGLENRIVYDLGTWWKARPQTEAMIRDKRLPNLCLIPAAQTATSRPSARRYDPRGGTAAASIL